MNYSCLRQKLITYAARRTRPKPLDTNQTPHEVQLQFASARSRCMGVTASVSCAMHRPFLLSHRTSHFHNNITTLATCRVSDHLSARQSYVHVAFGVLRILQRELLFPTRMTPAWFIGILNIPGFVNGITRNAVAAVRPGPVGSYSSGWQKVRKPV